MRAPTGMAQLIAQTENNLIKELPLRGSWHGAAVTEGVRQAHNARLLSEFVQNFGFVHLPHDQRQGTHIYGRQS